MSSSCLFGSFVGCIDIKKEMSKFVINSLYYDGNGCHSDRRVELHVSLSINQAKAVEVGAMGRCC